MRNAWLFELGGFGVLKKNSRKDAKALRGELAPTRSVAARQFNLQLQLPPLGVPGFSSLMTKLR